MTCEWINAGFIFGMHYTRCTATFVRTEGRSASRAFGSETEDDMVKRVGDKIFIAVAPKRGKGDIEEVAKGGINLIINNRPDGESDDQMSSAEIEATARRLHGLCPYSSGSGPNLR